MIGGPQRAGLVGRDLQISRRGRTVIAGLDLDVPDGGWAAVQEGASADASALLEVLAGRTAPAAGRLWLDGSPLDGLGAAGPRPTIGYVTGEHTLLGTLTAVENLAVVPYDPRGRPRERWRRAEEQLAAVGLPPSSWHNLVEQLSGGQQQRVAVARALVASPALVVMDEPASELDPDSTALLAEVLRAQVLRHGGCGVLATSDPVLRGICTTTISWSAGGSEV